MNVIERLHETFHRDRRAARLARLFLQEIPGAGDQEIRILDVGCGDGRLAESLMRENPRLKIEGLEVLKREDVRIPCRVFDGLRFPCEDGAYDGVLFSDVLHHTDEIEGLLKEARRAARHFILIKDHLREGLLALATLRLMDAVGNKRFGVGLPYHYLTRAEWLKIFQTLGFKVESWKDRGLGLYPGVFRLLFERRLHFIARLAVLPA